MLQKLFSLALGLWLLCCLPSEAAQFRESQQHCQLELQAGQYQAALEHCGSALATDPQATGVRLHRGLAYYRLGHYSEAVSDFQQLIEQVPDQAEGYYNLGLAESALGHYSAAIQIFNVALHRAIATKLPHHTQAEIYDDRGLAKLARQDLKAAIADFDQAIALNPKSERAYFNHACVCHRLGFVAKALDDLAVVLSADIANGDAYFMRAQLLARTGAIALAEHDLQQAAYYFYQQNRIADYERVTTFSQRLKPQQTMLA